MKHLPFLFALALLALWALPAADARPGRSASAHAFGSATGSCQAVGATQYAQSVVASMLPAEYRVSSVSSAGQRAMPKADDTPAPGKPNVQTVPGTTVPPPAPKEPAPEMPKPATAAPHTDTITTSGDDNGSTRRLLDVSDQRPVVADVQGVQGRSTGGDMAATGSPPSQQGITPSTALTTGGLPLPGGTMTQRTVALFVRSGCH